MTRQTGSALSLCHWAQFLCCHQNTAEIAANAAAHQSASSLITHTHTHTEVGSVLTSPFVHSIVLEWSSQSVQEAFGKKVNIIMKGD